ncbi:MAG: cyclic nucleotide-binding domain-containing protein [Candidatus Marinimicrobia bacterium]|nr:cyclic nucleotide-binding domain-containing protein [Candidatus Neomarinimicrobiota bacterium]
MNESQQASRSSVRNSHNSIGPLSLKMELTGTLIHFNEPPLLVAHFPKELAEKFIRLGREKAYATHMNILRKGQIGRDMFLICEGKVSVWKQSTLLGELGRKDVFGELIIYRDHYRIATIRTEEPTLVLKYNRQCLLDFFARQEPKYFNIFTMNIIEILRRKLISTNERVVKLEEQLLQR